MAIWALTIMTNTSPPRVRYLLQVQLDHTNAAVLENNAQQRYADLAPELQEQWERDRARKAENKRKRALDRLQIAADPLAKKKGGKKGIKAMLAAARFEDDDPELAEIPNRVIDFITLEQQIRRFILNVGGPQTMSLPPCNKEIRKKIHEMAQAFNLKSVSKGHGDARYTSLTKTTRTGIAVDEKKISRILRVERGYRWSDTAKGKAKVTSLAKHKEGEEVGKVACVPPHANIAY